MPHDSAADDDSAPGVHAEPVLEPLLKRIRAFYHMSALVDVQDAFKARSGEYGETAKVVSEDVHRCVSRSSILNQQCGFKRKAQLCVSLR